MSDYSVRGGARKLTTGYQRQQREKKEAIDAGKWAVRFLTSSRHISSTTKNKAERTFNAFLKQCQYNPELLFEDQKHIYTNNSFRVKSISSDQLPAALS